MNIDYSDLPSHMQDDAHGYIEHGIPLTHIPMGAWGSLGKVSAWCAKGGLREGS